MENPALGSAGRPAPMPGEVFVLSRRGIAFSAKDSAGSQKFEARGSLWLSTLRVVFVADRPQGGFGALDLPLATMRSESFNQPIFGANNMTGTSPPLPDSACAGDITWYLGFKDGGVGTFLPLFFSLLQVRSPRGHVRVALRRAAPYCSSPHPAGATRAAVTSDLAPSAAQDMRERMAAQQGGAAPQPAPEASVIQIVQAAYVDPSDPTQLYVQS